MDWPSNMPFSWKISLQGRSLQAQFQCVSAQKTPIQITNLVFLIYFQYVEIIVHLFALKISIVYINLDLIPYG